MINSHPLYRLSYRGIWGNINSKTSRGQAFFKKKSFFCVYSRLNHYRHKNLAYSPKIKACIRSMAFSKTALLVAKEIRTQPGVPKADPGTKASPFS